MNPQTGRKGWAKAELPWGLETLGWGKGRTRVLWDVSLEVETQQDQQDELTNFYLLHGRSLQMHQGGDPVRQGDPTLPACLPSHETLQRAALT